MGDATLILFKDGSLASYQQNIQYFGKTFVEDNGQILHCEGYTLKEAIYVVFIVEVEYLCNVLLQ